MARLFPTAGIVFEDFWKLVVEEMPLRIPYGSVVEWSKALVLGTSLFDDVGSNPTAASCYFLNSRFEIEDFTLVESDIFITYSIPIFSLFSPIFSVFFQKYGYFITIYQIS